MLTRTKKSILSSSFDYLLIISRFQNEKNFNLMTIYILKKMKEVAENPGLREKLNPAIQNHTKQFNWDNFAKEFWISLEVIKYNFD